MTDEYGAIGSEPMETGDAPVEAVETGEPIGGQVDAFGGDAAIAGSLPSIDDINLKNAKKAAEWAWDHTLGQKPQRKVEPGGISVDFDDEEETTMRSSSVAHEDPPPPDPNEHRTPHVTERR
jgi:hypothetical protein